MDVVRCTNATLPIPRFYTSRLLSFRSSSQIQAQLQRSKLVWDLGFGICDLGFAWKPEPKPQPEQTRHEQVREEQQRYRDCGLARHAERLQQNGVELLAQSKAIDRNRNVAEQRGGRDSGQQRQICRMRRCIE